MLCMGLSAFQYPATERFAHFWIEHYSLKVHHKNSHSATNIMADINKQNLKF